MIKFIDSKITDLLPVNIATSPEVQALSYAISNALKRMMSNLNNILIYTSIPSLPDNILDVLASELKTQYYSFDLPVETKREIIKNTLQWHQKSGTKSAVEELISTVFGTGRVSEWYEYGGEPYHFKAITDNMDAVQDKKEDFKRLLNSVKRLGAWLDSVSIIDQSVLEIKDYFKEFIKISLAVKDEEIIQTELFNIKINHKILESVSSEVVLRSDLWKLNGSIMLDGTRKIDASEKREEL